MEKNYTPPSISKTSFHCPHCGTKAPQVWLNCYGEEVSNKIPDVDYRSGVEKFAEIMKTSKEFNREEKEEEIESAKEYFSIRQKDAESGDFLTSKNKDGAYCYYSLDNIHFSVCQECERASLWVYDKLIIPSNDVEYKPHEDMPDDIKAVFLEASEINNKSPRAASALLRLCCEMLCNHLKAKGKNFNEQIGDLVKNGLDPTIQQCLDFVRFIGNEAIHPKEIDMQDTTETSSTLFFIVNEIVQEMISKPKRIKDLYENKLPEGVKKQIANRDKKAS